MATIPLAPAPAQYFTVMRAAAAATVDQLEIFANNVLNLKASYEEVIRRLDRMHHGFDGMNGRLNSMEEILDGMGERLSGVGKACDVMEETLEGMVERVYTMEERLNVMEERVVQLTYDNRLWPLRLHNAQCSLHAPIVWPTARDPPYPAGKPGTPADLRSMNAEMCIALAAALHLQRFPGPVQPSLEWRRMQIIIHLGCVQLDA